jgi:hypothetical protein
MLIGSIQGWVEFNQDVTPLDELPVLHMNGGDHTAFIRLNDLGVPVGNNLALCRGNNIDPA